MDRQENPAGESIMIGRVEVVEKVWGGKEAEVSCENVRDATWAFDDGSRPGSATTLLMRRSLNTQLLPQASKPSISLISIFRKG